jgi:ATP-dependent Clp protease adaptor protein ClpS
MSEKSHPTNKKTKKNNAPIRRPQRYKVVFFNDIFTPFKLVHMLLVIIFHKTEEEADTLSMAIHNNGKATVGIYTKEIALTKQRLTEFNLEKNGYPLICKIEPEND